MNNSIENGLSLRGELVGLASHHQNPSDNGN